jgi:hypothetical protein
MTLSVLWIIAGCLGSWASGFALGLLFRLTESVFHDPF